MSAHRRATHLGSRGIALGLLLGLGACGGSARSQPPASPTPPPPSSAAPAALAPDAPELDPPPILRPPGAPRPVKLQIPVLRLSAPLVSLGVAPDGRPELPPDPAQPGWYRDSPAPGDVGPAVIAGHLDSLTGPAVFVGLSRLRQGDEVDVVRADGSQVRFTVYRTERVSQTSFPVDLVYGPTPRPELRLMTCAGDWVESRRHYTQNLVVFATEII